MPALEGPRKLDECLTGSPTKILLKDINVLNTTSSSLPVVKGVKGVSSYNWLSEAEAQSKTPTIQVPGAPPVVSFPRGESILKLHPDSGHHFINQNAARMHTHSGMIPGISACYAYNPSFKVSDYDIITDRNNLIKIFELIELSEQKAPETVEVQSVPRQLYSPKRGRGRGFRGAFRPHPAFATGQSHIHGRGIERMNRRPDATRIDIDIVSGYNTQTGEYIYDGSVKKTMIMTRWELANEEVISSSDDFRGFGGSFLLETRRFLSVKDGEVVDKGPKELTGFHYLVEFELLGLRCLVRYHADGCSLSKEEFLEWVAEDEVLDGLRVRDDSRRGFEHEDSDSSDEGEDEEYFTNSNTFDLLDAFKKLDVQGKDEAVEHEPILSLESFTKKVKEAVTVPSPSKANKTTLIPNHPAKDSTTPPAPLKIEPTPNPVFPSSLILAVKTRGQHTGLNRESLYRQLFFSQTKNIFVAYHTKGFFMRQNTSHEDISEDLVKWGEDNRGKLEKLVGILKEVRNKAEEKGGKAAVMFVLKKEEEEVSIDVHERSDDVVDSNGAIVLPTLGPEPVAMI